MLTVGVVQQAVTKTDKHALLIIVLLRPKLTVQLLLEPSRGLWDTCICEFILDTKKGKAHASCAQTGETLCVAFSYLSPRISHPFSSGLNTDSTRSSSSILHGKVDNHSHVLVLVVRKEPFVVLEILVFMVFFVVIVLTNSLLQILVVQEAGIIIATLCVSSRPEPNMAIESFVCVLALLQEL